MARNKLPKTSGFSGLTPKKSKAIAALLSHPTVHAASRACGVSERTLYDWLRNDSDFRAALDTAQAEIIHDTLRRLSAGHANALSALEHLIAGAKHESVRRQSAMDYLGLLLRLHETCDLDGRIEKLEKVIQRHK